MIDLYNNPDAMMLLAMGAGMSDASGPSRMPVSFGQALSRGMGSALGAYQTAMQGQMNMARQRMMQEQVDIERQRRVDEAQWHKDALATQEKIAWINAGGRNRQRPEDRMFQMEEQYKRETLALRTQQQNYSPDSPEYKRIDAILKAKQANLDIPLESIIKSYDARNKPTADSGRPWMTFGRKAEPPGLTPFDITFGGAKKGSQAAGNLIAAADKIVDSPPLAPPFKIDPYDSNKVIPLGGEEGARLAYRHTEQIALLRRAIPLMDGDKKKKAEERLAELLRRHGPTKPGMTGPYFGVPNRPVLSADELRGLYQEPGMK